MSSFPTFPSSQKVTPAMESSLDILRQSLLCPICNKIMTDPSTLHCSHSFCLSCISNFHSWTCPVPGCNLPLSIRGNNKRSYIGINPQLSSVVSALESIVNSLHSAKVGWWKSTPNDINESPHKPGLDDDDDDDGAIEFNNSPVKKSLVDENTTDDCNEKIPSMKQKRPRFNYSSSQSSSSSNEDESDLENQKPLNPKHPQTNHALEGSPNLNKIAIDIDKDQKKTENDENVEEEYLPTQEYVSTQQMEASETNNQSQVGTNNIPIFSAQSELFFSVQSQSPEYARAINRSCRLPSTPPNVSPIHVVPSQEYNHETSQTNTPSKMSKHTKQSTPVPKFSVGIEILTKDSKINRSLEKDIKMAESSIKCTTQESPSTTNIHAPPKPRVILLSPVSDLSSADIRSFQKCLKNDLFDMLTTTAQSNSNYSLSDLNLEFDFDFDSEKDASTFLSTLFNSDDANIPSNIKYCFAVNTNPVFQTCDGYIVSRSFRYILAVACGIPMMDISFIRTASTNAAFLSRTPPHHLYAPGIIPNDDENSTTTTSRRKRGSSKIEEQPLFVIGDTNSSEWMAPQRAFEVRKERFNCISNGLLSKFTIHLAGSFDNITKEEEIKSIRKKNKDLKEEDASDNLYSHGRMSLLLRLCGASVVDDVDKLLVDGVNHENVLILVRANSTMEDRKQIRKSLLSSNKSSDCLVLCGNWLIDSISNFQVQDFSKYE